MIYHLSVRLLNFVRIIAAISIGPSLLCSVTDSQFVKCERIGELKKSHNYISDHSELHWHQHVILVRPCKKESNVEDHQSVKYKNDGPHELRRCENRVSFGGEKIWPKLTPLHSCLICSKNTSNKKVPFINFIAATLSRSTIC